MSPEQNLTIVLLKLRYSLGCSSKQGYVWSPYFSDAILTGSKPAVICGVFLFIGTSLLLYWRARVGPGPYIIPMILSCIMMGTCLIQKKGVSDIVGFKDISLTVAPMFPYPSYVVSESINPLPYCFPLHAQYRSESPYSNHWPFMQPSRSSAQFWFSPRQ